jgi:radical SAM protein with 4Fe4S-binding SPASM domain
MEEALRLWQRKGSFSLTGGEPFLRRRELFHLMDRLDASNVAAYYDILTNGSLICDKDIRRLREASKLRRIQLSLEGATAGENDAIRGDGDYASTLRAIDLLKEAGLEVSVMETVTRRNMASITAMVDLLAAHKVDAFAVERHIPEGTGRAMRELSLSPEEARQVFQLVHSIGVAERRVRILMHRPLFTLLDRYDSSVGAVCSVGINALTVMHDGTVYPCRRLPIPLGNILEDGLFKIWYDSAFLWSVRESARIDGCGDCELVSLCRGCRAMAYHVTGDVLARDPQCWKDQPCTA